MATCSKHGCVLTETITDDVFCGVCRDAENKQTIKELEDSVRQLAHSVQCERFVVEQLKLSVISTMIDNGWTYEDAHKHVDTEFTAAKAAEILKTYENNHDTL